MMSVTLITAFFGGIASFLSPCVLPIIPGFLAFISGTSLKEAETNRGRIFLSSLLFVIGFSTVFAALGVLLNTILGSVAYNTQTWLSRIGGAIVIFFGLSLTGLIHIGFLEREHKFRPRTEGRPRILTALLFGAAFAAGWTPCVGPALGAILGLAAAQPGTAFSLLLAYSLGLGVPFLVLGLFTNQAARLIQKYTRFLHAVQVVFGIILIALGILIATQQLSRLANFGFLNRLLLKQEAPTDLPKNTPPSLLQPPTVPALTPALTPQDRLAEKQKRFSRRAPEIVAPSGFINTPPLKISDLIGRKVVLVDFWTYSCINCQRVTPYLNAWYKQYRDQGLEIIGIHTPEFEFEKKIANVKIAVEKSGIAYPVVLDNDYGTWRAYRNLYWPRKYLIDIDGFVVYDHIGEGAYQETEEKIRELLAERMQVLGMKGQVEEEKADVAGAVTADFSKIRSPETYFGAARNELLANGVAGSTGEQNFSMPKEISGNALFLGGRWNVRNEYAENLKPGARIAYRYQAKNIYMVASAKKPVTLSFTFDGKPAGKIIVQADALYTLISGQSYGEHVLEITIEDAGLKAYTFTFG